MPTEILEWCFQGFDYRNLDAEQPLRRRGRRRSCLYTVQRAWAYLPRRSLSSPPNNHSSSMASTLRPVVVTPFIQPVFDNYDVVKVDITELTDYPNYYRSALLLQTGAMELIFEVRVGWDIFGTRRRFGSKV